MDKNIRLALLMDFYAPLLTVRQRDILSLHIHEDLSYGEIAGELGISRQAAADAAKVAGEQLEELEAKLCLLNKHNALSRCAAELLTALSGKDIHLAIEIAERLKRLIDEEDENAL